MDNDDAEAVGEHAEALELVSGQSDYEAIRKAASLGLHYLLVVLPASRLPVLGSVVIAAGD